MTMMTVELAEAELEVDERCVWCEAAHDVAHTVDGFCVFCGATGHPCA